ncbi:MAG: hypothetical protein HYY61_04690 [Deltaproteobacteria bacterium]|nr:hypothetical protein [Deltaproteobacteria bacterium]
MKQTLLLIIFVAFLGLSFAQAHEANQADGLRIDSANPEQAYSPMQCMCYPWVWSWNTWWHHHVYWGGCGWIHTYSRADYVYHGFFNRYVWVCTWPNCGAIRF